MVTSKTCMLSLCILSVASQISCSDTRYPEIDNLITALTENRIAHAATTYKPYVVALEVDYQEKQALLVQQLIANPGMRSYICNHHNQKRSQNQAVNSHDIMLDLIYYMKAKLQLRIGDISLLQQYALTPQAVQNTSPQFNKLCKKVSALNSLIIEIEPTVSNVQDRDNV